jgi:hypothetical protein
MRPLRLLTLLAGLSMSGCYFVDQPRFESQVHSWIRIDMPFAEALSILGNHGMRCSGGNPASCSRLRGGLQPYSCIERVQVSFAGQWMLVDKIEIAKIACAGL